MFAVHNFPIDVLHVIIAGADIVNRLIVHLHFTALIITHITRQQGSFTSYCSPVFNLKIKRMHERNTILSFTTKIRCPSTAWSQIIWNYSVTDVRSRQIRFERRLFHACVVTERIFLPYSPTCELHPRRTPTFASILWCPTLNGIHVKDAPLYLVQNDGGKGASRTRVDTVTAKRKSFATHTSQGLRHLRLGKN